MALPWLLRSSVGGDPGRIQFGALKNTMIINIFAQDLLWACGFFPLLEFLGHRLGTRLAS